MRKAAYIFFVAFSLACIGYSCFNKNKSEVEESKYLNHDQKATYVGIDVCKACHSDIYNTFSETGMGKSWGIANKSKTSATFGIKNLVFDSLKNFYYYPFFNGDTMQILEFRLEGKDTIYKRLESIKYIVGSGQHTNSHLIDVNGFLYQAPLTFYTQKGHWNLPPGFEGGNNSRFGRAIELECVTCHNALPEFDEQSQNKFNAMPLGLSCERCHGPGSIHVEEKQKGNLVDIKNEIDYTIVNPAKLPWQLQVDVCQRCHLQGNAILKEGKSFFDFRPGMMLSNIVDVYMPRFEGDDSKFIMASHAERLQKSKCFIRSNENDENSNKLTCITCHNPHVSVKKTGKEIFNTACKNCHSSNICKAPKSSLEKEKNNCVKCHMPNQGTTDIPHVSVHDHYIRKPLATTQRNDLQKFIGISCVNNQEPTAESKAEGYLNYFEKFDTKAISCLDSAWFYLQKCKNRKDLWVHYYYLKNDYVNLISIIAGIKTTTIRDAWTAYRISEAYSQSKEFGAAEEWIERALQLKPKQLNFMLKAGKAKYNLGKFGEAKAIYESILILNQKFAEAWNSLGLVICDQGRGDLPKAMEYYQKALALDPDMESALINCLDLANATGDDKNFLKYLKRLYKISPNNPKLLPMYIQFKLNKE